MNRSTIIAAFFALVFLGGQCALAQSGYNLFQKGLIQERVKGDLDEAIKIYERIIVKFPENRPIVAKALLHIGLCYEKMGKQEAQKAYQRVIEEYPGQKQEVAKAKERIAEISKELKGVAHQPTFRKIQIASRPQNGVLSPDGNKLAFMSDGAVWIVPLHGKVDPDIAGEPTRLAEVPGIWEASGMMAWSADGKWIAVYGGNPSDSDGGKFVSVLPVAGGKPRLVQLPKQGGHLYSYRLSLSPDGQILAFSALEFGKSPKEIESSSDRRIYTISTAEGEPKQVSSGWALLPSFSPDGKFIAYVGYRRRNTEGSRYNGDLWVAPSDGGTPIKLTSVNGRLRGPVWSSDGKYIAAHHEPLGGNPSDEIWVYPLSPDVYSAGEPTKIVLPRETYRILTGWSPGGELGIFIESETHRAIYTVAASGGRAVQVTPEGKDGPYYPRWSPDGERIYFRWTFVESDSGRIRDVLSGHEATAYVPAKGGDPLGIPPMESGQELGMVIPGGGFQISPDGKKIVLCAYQKKRYGVWTIPRDGGLPVQLTNDGSYCEGWPCWSPDGRSIAFSKLHWNSEDETFYTIHVIPAKGGEARQITSEADSVGGGAIAFSPDGKRIAFFSDGAIKTIPVEGGEPKVLVAEVKSGRHSQLAYFPDGSKIVHNATGKIWITSLDGGEPEELQTGLPEGARLSDLSLSLDGENIAFVGTIGGEAEFWLIGNFLPKSKAGE